MGVQAIRLTRLRYADSALSGEGARLYGGRFNSPGRRVVYAASSVALALLEILVQAVHPNDLTDYIGIALMFDEDLVEEIGDLPMNWRDNTWPSSVQALGDRWLDEKRSPVLRVPSAVIATENNYLFNPLHEHFHKIRHHTFKLDLNDRVYTIGRL